MKRLWMVLGVVLLVLAAPVVAIAYSTFAGLSPLEDEVDLPSGARQVKDGYVAIFVLPAGEKQVALVDCGNDAKGEAILRELGRRGLGPDAVKVVFLTHAHPDHIAGCHLFPNAQVLAFAGDVGLAEGTARAKGPLPSKLDTPVEKRTKVTRPLVDGETVTLGPLQVKAYAVPGHTAGSAAFLAGGVLYLGDNCAAQADGLLRPAPWAFSDDQHENQKSLEALAKRLKAEGAQVKKMAFAHSGPVDTMAALEGFKAQQ